MLLSARGLAALRCVKPALPAWNVLIGGESGIPDLLVRDAMSATFPVRQSKYATCSGERCTTAITIQSRINTDGDLHHFTNVAASASCRQQ